MKAEKMEIDRFRLLWSAAETRYPASWRFGRLSRRKKQKWRAVGFYLYSIAVWGLVVNAGEIKRLEQIPTGLGSLQVNEQLQAQLKRLPFLPASDRLDVLC